MQSKAAMTPTEKAQYIRENGADAYNGLPELTASDQHRWASYFAPATFDPAAQLRVKTKAPAAYEKLRREAIENAQAQRGQAEQQLAALGASR